ncbi:MAG: helix-turn-helix domain-containing protein [Prevotella sp.]
MNKDIIHNDISGRAGMLLCTSGSRKVLINGQLYVISEGMLCFLSPIISVFELSRDDCYQEIAIIDEAEVFFQAIRDVYDMILEFRMRDTPCLQLDDESIRLFVERQKAISKKREHAYGISDAGEKNLVMRIIQLMEQQTMLEFVHLYFLGRTVSPASINKNETIAFRFIYSLHTNRQHERSVAFYAGEAGLSPNHFSRIIREQTGKTPSEWIASMIIINAKSLLKQKDLNIKDVAARLNFPEQYTFRKFFKLHVGMSPKEYRNQLTKEVRAEAKIDLTMPYEEEEPKAQQANEAIVKNR